MGNPETGKSSETKTPTDRSSEATSDKTVSDLEETEETSDSNSSSPSDETSVPSPDGSPDPDLDSGRADGSDTGGPM
jgi:hypothetical protein